jgi:proteasome accessory factor C
MPRRGPEPVGDRLRRLLVMLPWLMERGDTPVAEVATRFGVSEAQVIRDVELASCCGVPPYLDELLDVWIDDDMVSVGPPRIFTRPLRLTAKEGVTLLAAVQAAVELPGSDPHGPLARAAEKLRAAVGGDVVVDVERPPFLDAVEQATRASERLRISYYAASHDEVRERVIDPQAVFLHRGNWYVAADDEQSGEERRLRVDRIEACTPTGEHFRHRDIVVPDERWFEADDSRVAVLRLPPAAAWVMETYPVLSADRADDGFWTVHLVVASERWLARLLLRVGAEAEVVSPAELREVGRNAARSVLARYA